MTVKCFYGEIQNSEFWHWDAKYTGSLLIHFIVLNFAYCFESFLEFTKLLGKSTQVIDFLILFLFPRLHGPKFQRIPLFVTESTYSGANGIQMTVTI